MESSVLVLFLADDNTTHGCGMADGGVDSLSGRRQSFHVSLAPMTLFAPFSRRWDVPNKEFDGPRSTATWFAITRDDETGIVAASE
ncbi:MAG: hypothetical protein KGJ60_12515 [Verrucomicrobiota bacterium]|nr:hypothetical protein [Verrucomicrobiota bacterium]